MKRIILISSIFILIAVPAFAVLQDNGDGTVTQIRNDGSVLMWLQDANYAATSGYCSILGNCLDSYGQVTWTQVSDWVTYLNNINYAGYSDWRLPETLPVNGSSYNWNWSYDGSTDRGWNISSLNSEMGYLFYEELGNIGEYDINGNGQSGYGISNSGPFTNIVSTWYWSSSDAVGMSYDKVGFNFGLGRQYGGYIPGHSNRGWALRTVSGPVVPEPISSILFLTGGATLGLRRYLRRN